MLEQNMNFMFNQLRMILPNHFSEQLPFPIMPNNQNYLIKVDEEDTHNSVQQIEPVARSWPSEIG